MDERPTPVGGWQYGLVIHAVNEGWWCQLVRYHRDLGRIVWEEWLMPSSDTRTDARTITGEIWAAATELLERNSHLT